MLGTPITWISMGNNARLRLQLHDTGFASHRISFYIRLGVQLQDAKVIRCGTDQLSRSEVTPLERWSGVTPLHFPVSYNCTNPMWSHSFTCRWVKIWTYLRLVPCVLFYYCSEVNAEWTKSLFLRQSSQCNVISLNYVGNLFAIGVIKYKKLRLWLHMKQSLRE